jgi:hypothetical protein
MCKISYFRLGLGEIKMVFSYIAKKKKKFARQLKIGLLFKKISYVVFH